MHTCFTLIQFGVIMLAVGPAILHIRASAGHLTAESASHAVQPEPNSVKTFSQEIDRRALVTRHNVTLNKSDPLTPLSVGNGEFAFTADVTGLQTFPQYYQQGMSLGTQSQWGWHTIPPAEGKSYTLVDILENYFVAGREVPYASDKEYS